MCYYYLAKTQYLRYRIIAEGDGCISIVWPQLLDNVLASGHMIGGSTIEHPF